MKRLIPTLLLLPACLLLLQHSSVAQTADENAAGNGNDILLKNYHPVSIYNIPVTRVIKAAWPVTDMHSHDYAKSDADIDRWVKAMDSSGIARTVILTYSTGARFDSIVDRYSRYKGRFLFYCGFDYTGFGQPGWAEKAIAELNRCYQKGARGIGELGDKGEGELYSHPTPGRGIHIDNPALKPLLSRCGALKMPIVIHVAEDRWMYQQPDASNDGLMNAEKWHVNMQVPGKLDHDQLLASLSKAVAENPNVTFIACHFANCCSDLNVLGDLLAKYPNLYADIAARYAETGPIPRFAAAFITRWQDRLVYGTDMGMEASMYRSTFRILETTDEHFYDPSLSDYHWALYGFSLPKDVLRKLYQTNAEKIIHQ
ncbi:MAG TPA: amidohydrolase family protein [Puia sp.]|jgi:predicted TIM-barrel fold metal-dependent hydrolase